VAVVIEVITWTDAVFDLDEGESYEDFLVQTVGWVTRDTPKWITVAAELLPDGTHRAVTHTPAVLVEKRLPLAFVEPA
jgi:hypothetical protein